MQKQTKMDDLIHYGNQSERVRISTRAMTFNETNMSEATTIDQETDLDSNEQVEKIELPHPNNVKPFLNPNPSKSIDQNIQQKIVGQEQQNQIKTEKKVVKVVESEDSNKQNNSNSQQVQQQQSQTPNKQHKFRSLTQKAKIDFNPIVEEEPQNEQSATIGVNQLVKELENSLKIKENEEKKDNQNNEQNKENSQQKSNEKVDIIKSKILQPPTDLMKNHLYKHLIFSPNCSENQFKRHLLLTYRGLVYAKKCLKGPSMKFIKSKQVTLANSKSPKKKTLFFDLDETLIHSCQLKENPQVEIKAVTDVGQETILGINIRPYCIEILEKLSDYFDIFVFTASSPTYATAIIKHLDPQTKYIQGILSRVNCMETKNGFFIKDLRIIKNRELKDMVIVDNLAHSFGFQIDNGIPIMEWHNNTKDTELKYICEYLIKLSKFDDIREFNAQQLKLNELADLTAEELQI